MNAIVRGNIELSHRHFRTDCSLLQRHSGALPWGGATGAKARAGALQFSLGAKTRKRIGGKERGKTRCSSTSQPQTAFISRGFKKLLRNFGVPLCRELRCRQVGLGSPVDGRNIKSIRPQDKPVQNALKF